METLEQLDAAYNAAERLGQHSPLDAIPIARGTTGGIAAAFLRQDPGQADDQSRAERGSDEDVSKGCLNQDGHASNQRRDR